MPNADVAPLRPLPNGQWEAAVPGDVVHYFAYGSNLHDRTIRRRRLEPRSVRAAVVEDYALTLDHAGIPFAEPTFASIRQEPGSVCLGAILSISKRAFHRLIDTEGGGGGRAPGYVPILVNATLLDTGETVEALTLWTVPSDRRGGLPSRRYRNLVADGAEQRSLPAPYVARLRALPAYKSTLGGRVVLIVVGALLGALAILPGAIAILLRRAPSARVREAGRVLYHRILWVMKIVLWAVHDVAHLFGRARAPILVLVEHADPAALVATFQPPRGAATPSASASASASGPLSAAKEDVLPAS